MGNGKELLSESARLHPDVIVVDITMPELSGIEAVHELRSSGSRAKVVFLTVQTRIEFVQACFAEGALGYVTKSRLATDLIPRDPGCAVRASVCFPFAVTVARSWD